MYWYRQTCVHDLRTVLFVQHFRSFFGYFTIVRDLANRTKNNKTVNACKSHDDIM